MTDADTTKKLKPAATIARSESIKDLSTLVCNVCHGNMWCKNDRWIGGYCVEKKVHVCSYCKKLEMQKQARLVRPESVKNFNWYSSSEEEDAKESLVPKEIEESLGIIWKNIHRPQMRLPMQHHLASSPRVPGRGHTSSQHLVSIDNSHQCHGVGLGRGLEGGGFFPCP